MSDRVPILFLMPLTDRRGQLDALALHLAAVQEPAWLPLDPALSELAAAIACRLAGAGNEPPPLTAALLAAGIAPLDSGDLDPDPSALPGAGAGHRWLASRWYFLPPSKPSATQVASRALALKLVQLVSEDADTFEIEAIFRQEPTLAYHLLRLVNSPGLGLGREITSFSQAILILGRQRLRRWLNLLLFSAAKDDPRAPMLLTVAAVRARLMELIFQHLGHDRRAQDRAFMAGLFSLIGILFGQPLADLLRPLQISDEVIMGLLHHEGELGEAMRLAELAEAPDAASLGAQLGKLGLPAADFNRLQIAAHLWMLGVIRAARGGAK